MLVMTAIVRALYVRSPPSAAIVAGAHGEMELQIPERLLLLRGGPTRASCLFYEPAPRARANAITIFQSAPALFAPATLPSCACEILAARIAQPAHTRNDGARGAGPCAAYLIRIASSRDLN